MRMQCMLMKKSRSKDFKMMLSSGIWLLADSVLWFLGIYEKYGFLDYVMLAVSLLLCAYVAVLLYKDYRQGCEKREPALVCTAILAWLFILEVITTHVYSLS